MGRPSYTQAWPLARGRAYARFPITDTATSPEDSAVDDAAVLQERIRYGYKLGWTVMQTDDAAELEAAAELTGCGMWALPFAEWDAFAQHLTLVPVGGWLGDEDISMAVPFFGAAAPDADPPQVRLLIDGDEGRPVATFMYQPSVDWPTLDRVEALASDVTSAGASDTTSIVLRYYVPVRRVRMCAMIGDKFQLTAVRNTIDRWAADLQLEEHEGATRAMFPWVTD